MKKKIYAGLAALGLLVSAYSFMRADPGVIFNVQIVNDPVVTSTRAYVVDVNDKAVNRLAAFIVYSTVSVPAIAFTDGRTSTAALTISSNTALSSAAATIVLTVSSNAALTYKYFTLNGRVFKENVDWSSCEWFPSSRTAHNFSTATAVSIAASVNFSSYGVTASTVANSVVRITVREKGVVGNSYSISASTVALSLSATGYMTGGRNPTIFKINSVAFEADKDFVVALTSSRTAQNISNAIVANTFINTLVVSSWTTNGVIWATSTFVDQSSFTLYSSSNAALVISSVSASYADGSAVGRFVGGSTSAVNLATDYISSTNTFGQGQAVLVSTGIGTLPSPLIPRTTYFVLNPNGSQFQLAFTATGALAGLAIDISTMNQRGGGTFTAAPLGYSATAPQSSFKFRVSNDRTNWLDYTSPFTANFSSFTAVDFGNWNYRYIEFSINASSNTPTSFNAYLNGKP